MAAIEIWHNPRCSKSRQTLELLQQNNISPSIVLYLELPPSEQQLKKVLSMLGMSARALMRIKESLYKELDLNEPNLSEDALIKAMTQHPKLIERPVVINGNKAAIGRPPEAVLSII